MYIHPIDESIDYKPTIHNQIILRKRVKERRVYIILLCNRTKRKNVV